MNLPHQSESHQKKNLLYSHLTIMQMVTNRIIVVINESDLNGECSAEPVNTAFASPGMIKGNHRIYN